MSRIKELKEYGFNTVNRTYVIAELGINHGGDIEIAKQLIDSAAKTGVDAVKFQTYLTEKRAPEGNEAVFDILKKCELPFEAFGKLKEHAKAQNLDFFSTPFDTESVDYLESINCDLYKVASFDTVNHELLDRISKTGKPIIMSVGMSNMEEIIAAYDIITQSTKNIAILHCISAYPTKEEDANLSAFYTLQDRFDCVLGQSDHTNDIVVPLYAVAGGAQVIEKHYKIDEEMDCADGPVSITESQTRKMVEEIRRIERIFGKGELGVRDAEKDIVVFRRHTVKS